MESDGRAYVYDFFWYVRIGMHLKFVGTYVRTYVRIGKYIRMYMWEVSRPLTSLCVVIYDVFEVLIPRIRFICGKLSGL